MDQKTYLGDGVYAVWNGYALVLTTENGIEATNEIHLEPFVVNALFATWERVVHDVQAAETERARQVHEWKAKAAPGPSRRPSESEGNEP